MESLGFKEEGKYFVHDDTNYFIEFPSGPLGVGDAPIEKLDEIRTKFGTLKLLTPTDCVKDRLAAYFHWDDNQSLQQAVWVAQQNSVNIDELREWAKAEKSSVKFENFTNELEVSN